MGQAKEGLMAVYKLQGSHIPGPISSGKLISCVQSRQLHVSHFCRLCSHLVVPGYLLDDNSL